MLLDAVFCVLIGGRHYRLCIGGIIVNDICLLWRDSYFFELSVRLPALVIQFLN
jgi:hypothetical protein